LSKTAAAIALLLCGLLLAGCGTDETTKPPLDSGKGRTAVDVARPVPARKEAAPPQPPPEEEPGEKQAEPQAKRPTTKEPAAPAREPDDFDEKLGEVLALEEDARIFEAMKLCRDLRVRFKEHPKVMQLDGVATRLRAEKLAAAGMPAVIEKLGSEDSEVAKVARASLKEAGQLGAIFLRKAVRERADTVAIEAAKLLAAIRDARAPHTFATRLTEDPPKPLRAALCKGLAELGDLVDAETCASLYAAVKGDAEMKHWDRADVLCAVLEKRCRGDGEKFGEFLKDEEAHATLVAYVRKALESGNEALAAWGEGRAPGVGCLAKGVRGSYYAGIDFEKLLLEQLDAKIDFTEKTLPFPEGKVENVSVRWTGLFRVRIPGTFMFIVESDDGERLWVDDLELLNDWTMHAAEENQASVELTKGFHALKLEYMNGKGEAAIRLYWTGPGFNKRLMTDRDLLTLPWKDMKRAKEPK